MSSYQQLKADEVKFVLVRLDERLAECPRGERDPVIILECLEEHLTEIAQDYLAKEAIFRDPDFGLDALNRLGVIISSLSLIEYEYLPAVAHQNEEERTLRVVFLKCAERLGLDWIEDIVVHSSGILAIYPDFLTVLSIPVIHVQANFFDKCLTFPGAFHEFGHSVFLRFPDFYEAMKREVEAHFDAMRRAIGPVPEEERQVQLDRFQDAQGYWDDSRLAEIFCDLFGQYVAGSANMISMIDLSMAQGQQACDASIPGYPPDAARVKVCEYALTPEQANWDVIKGLMAEWEKYAEIENAGSFYRDVCHEKLLRRFTTVVIDLVATLMPNTPRNVGLLPDIAAATGPFESLTFEEVTQRGMAILLTRPDFFGSWWREARAKIC
jgi:hypothetical protein